MKKLLFFFICLPSVAFPSGIYNPGSGTGGGGGSGPSGQINNGTQYQVPYYSFGTSSNVLTAVDSPFYNVKQFGAVGNGSTDDTASFQAAIDTAGVSGGAVYIPPGTYKVTNVIMRSNVHLKGAGIDITTLIRGGVGDVIISSGFASWTGTGLTGGIHEFSIEDMTINGTYDSDKSTNTTLNGAITASDSTILLTSTAGFSTSGIAIITEASGVTDGLSEAVAYTGISGLSLTGVIRSTENTVAQAHSSGDIVALRDQGYGIRIYGYSYKLRNLVIRRTRQDGLYSEWAAVATGLPLPNSMESVIENLKIYYCQGHGMTWKGPHDTKMHDVIVWLNQLIGIRQVGNAAAENFVNSHSYGKQVYSWYLGGGGQLTNCIGEQAINGQFFLAQNETLMDNVWAFGTSGTPVKGFVIGNASNLVRYSRINGYCRNCEAGAIDFTGDAGYNHINMNIYQTTGNEFVGTVSTKTYLQVIDGGGGAVINGNTTNIPAGTRNVTVSSAGFVGVGVYNPTSPLEVFSTLNPLSGLNSAVNYPLYLHKTSFATGAGTGIGFGDAAAPTVQAGIVSVRKGAGIGDLEFYTSPNGATGNIERLRITENGLVGISTGVPATTLEVFGGIKAATMTLTAFNVTTTSTTMLEPVMIGGDSSGLVINSNVNGNTKIGSVHLDTNGYYVLISSDFVLSPSVKYQISSSGQHIFRDNLNQNIVNFQSPLTANKLVATDSSLNLVSYDLLNTTQTWNASQTISSLTATSFTDSSLTSGRCVETATGGLLTTAAGACGTGSGGGGGYYVEPATVTFNMALGIKGSTIAFTAFNATTTSATVTGAGGLNVVGTLNTNTISQLQTIYGNDGTGTLNLYDSLADNVNVCKMTVFGWACKSNSAVGSPAAAIDGTGGSSVGIGVLGTSGSGTGIIGVKGVTTQDTGVGLYGSCAPLGNKTCYAVQGITSAAGASSTLYAGHFDGVNSAGSTVYGLWTSATGGASNYGLWVDKGLVNIPAPEGVSISYGLTGSSGSFNNGLVVSSGAIIPTPGPFTVATNNAYVSYTNSAGAAASTSMIFTSSVTNRQPNIGAAEVLIDQNITLTAGSAAMAAGAFNALGTISKQDQGTYSALGGNSNISAGSMFGQYGGQVSIDMVAGVNAFAVRVGTGTTREMDAITTGVQQSSGGTVATAWNLMARRMTSVAGGVVTNGGGILIAAQPPAAGTLTNPVAFESDGSSDIVKVAGHMVTFGPIPQISACGAIPSGSVVGTDNGGTITVGGGVVTACTLTFSQTWGVAPNCTYSDNSTTVSVSQSAISATAFTVATSATLGGGLITYRCGCDNQSGCK